MTDYEAFKGWWVDVMQKVGAALPLLDPETDGKIRSEFSAACALAEADPSLSLETSIAMLRHTLSGLDLCLDGLKRVSSFEARQLAGVIAEGRRVLKIELLVQM